jgi:molecular chaperone DnaJ
MAAATTKDLYELLGVKENASAAEIKKAYRDLAKRYHPDRTGGDKTKETRFKEINAAHEVLSDPKRRQQYDAMRRGGFAGGPEAYDFSAFEGIDGIEDLLGKIFGGFTGFGAGRRGARSPGGGAHVVFESMPFGGFDVHTARVGGTHGRAAAEASPGNADVTRDIEVTIEEAVLGARVEVPTHQGRVTVTIPAGTPSGQKLRLRGRGRPRPDGSHGDLYLVTKIVVPHAVDSRAAELIRQFSERAPVKPRR